VKFRCEVCGEPANVHISNENADGATLRHLCLQCAADEDDLAPREPMLNLAAVLVVVGLFILVISLFADVLAFGRHEGFGWQQQAGLALAAVFVLTAALVRIPTVLAIGLMIGAITVLADWLGLGNAEDFGIRQVAGTLLGLLLIGAGWLVARRGQAGERQTRSSTRRVHDQRYPIEPVDL